MILSLDVGIKNIGYTIYDEINDKIIEWNVINVLEKEIEENKKIQCELCENHFYANYLLKLDELFECKNNINICKRHKNKIKSIEYENTEKKICESCNIKPCKYSIIMEKNKNKKSKDLTIDEFYLCKKCNTKFNKKCIKVIKYKKVNSKNVSLEQILINNIKIFDEKYKHFLDCNMVLIEQQPGKKKKMTTVGNNIYSYFLIRGLLNDDSNINSVKVISSSCKLFIYPKKLKNTYKKRKALSIKVTKKYLDDNSNDINDDIINIFNNKKKQDDVADSFLQVLSYFNRLPRL